MTQLLQGDCLELLPQIPAGSVDCVIADLPYQTTRISWDTGISLPPLWGQLERITKENAAILLFSQMPFTAELYASNPKMWRYDIIWEKTQPTGFLNAKKMPLRKHEIICVFYRRLPTYNPQMSDKPDAKGMGRTRHNGTQAQQYNPYITGSWEWTETGKRYPADVIRFSNWNGALFGNTDKTIKHPTAKPVPLLEYLIRTYTDEGEIVLDCCMGSGSTGVAAINTGRGFVGIELDAGYFEIAQTRIQAAQEAISREGIQEHIDI